MQDQAKKLATKLLKSDNRWFSLVRDIVAALLIVALVMSIVYAYSGSVTPLVAVESGSMEPHINIGDVVLIKRPTEVVTYKEGETTNYQSFGNFGDVIVYRPNGDANMTPIIHRAMYWVNAGDTLPNKQKAEHAGYITKGDNNLEVDQPSLFSGMPRLEPVKPEWIIGVAKLSVPGLGYFRLALPNGVVDPLLLSSNIKPEYAAFTALRTGCSP
ncbi:MAG: signal peptidase I [Halobacteriota archaeon]